MILNRILINPLYIVLSFLITFSVVVSSITPLITIISIQNYQILQKIIFYIYISFILETLIRIISRNKFFRSFLVLDIFSLLPYLSIFLFKINMESPIISTFQFLFFLRLVPLFYFIIYLKSFQVKENISSFVYYFSSTLSITIFILLLSWITFMIILYSQYIESEKLNRIHQVENLSKIYNLKELKEKFPEWIIKIEDNSKENNFEILYIDEQILRNYLIPNTHFVYLQGKNPAQGIIISFIDLYKNQNLLVFTFLILSFLIVSFMNFMIQYFLKREWLILIEKAIIVTKLRLFGEIIPNTDLTLNDPKIVNEIYYLIQLNDELYKKLLETESSK